jgi:chlorite dismutase
MANFAISFVGGESGDWQVTNNFCLCGDPVAPVTALSRIESNDPQPGAVWQMRSYTSNLRYTLARERDALNQRSAALGRGEARCGALIPIRKSAVWWALAQDERREIYEERSRHTSIGMEYLPQIARKLHHCRELGEPFDFLTWFEYAPEHSGLFDDLLGRLRSTEEWTYVEREVDLRVERAN